MNRLIRVSALVLTSMPLLVAAPPKAVLVLHTEGAVRQGVANFEQRFGPGAMQVVIAGERNAALEIPSASVLFMQHPTAEFLKAIKPAADAAMKRGMKVITDVPEVLERQWNILPDPEIGRAHV